MALIRNLYEADLILFKEEVRRNPDADFMPRIRELANEFQDWEDKRKKNAIRLMLLNLYEEDVQSLRRDITKVIVMGAEKAMPSQRGPLFCCLCDLLSLHTKEDFADILAMCDQMEKDSAEDEDQ